MRFHWPQRQGVEGEILILLRINCFSMKRARVVPALMFLLSVRFGIVLSKGMGHVSVFVPAGIHGVLGGKWVLLVLLGAAVVFASARRIARCWETT